MALEKEVQKNLKKMGFPDTESAASPMVMVPKAIQCVQRRLQRLDECMDALDALKKKKEEKSRAAVTLEKFLGCRNCRHLARTGMLMCNYKDDQQDTKPS